MRTWDQQPVGRSSSTSKNVSEGSPRTGTNNLRRMRRRRNCRMSKIDAARIGAISTARAPDRAGTRRASRSRRLRSSRRSSRWSHRSAEPRGCTRRTPRAAESASGSRPSPAAAQRSVAALGVCPERRQGPCGCEQIVLGDRAGIEAQVEVGVRDEQRRAPRRHGQADRKVEGRHRGTWPLACRVATGKHASCQELGISRESAHFRSGATLALPAGV